MNEIDVYRLINDNPGISRRELYQTTQTKQSRVLRRLLTLGNIRASADMNETRPGYYELVQFYPNLPPMPERFTDDNLPPCKRCGGAPEWVTLDGGWKAIRCSKCGRSSCMCTEGDEDEVREYWGVSQWLKG